jgi:hypothetical protein
MVFCCDPLAIAFDCCGFGTEVSRRFKAPARAATRPLGERKDQVGIRGRHPHANSRNRTANAQPDVVAEEIGAAENPVELVLLMALQS